MGEDHVPPGAMRERQDQDHGLGLGPWAQGQDHGRRAGTMGSEPGPWAQLTECSFSPTHKLFINLVHGTPRDGFP